MATLVSYPARSLKSLTLLTRSRIPHAHDQDLDPHTMSRKLLLMNDERKVTAVCLPSLWLTTGLGPSKVGLPSSQSRGAQAKKWAEFQSFVPRRYLTAKCMLTKLSTCSRDQMMCGFSCIHAKKERDLYLNRHVNADESCFWNGSSNKSCRPGEIR